MSPNIKKTRWIYHIMPFVIVTVFLCLVIAPSDYTYTKNDIATLNHVGVIVQDQLSLKPVRIYYITGAGNEILNDIEANLTIVRSLHDYKNIIYRIFNILLSTIEFGVFIYFLGYFIRRKKQHIPIMAMSIGGHAPPKICLA